MHRFPLAVAAAALAALPACSTYDFDQARRADGSFDIPKLIADLEASGQDRLDCGTWIPLLYLDVVSFERTAVPMAAGYHLEHFRSYGPAFCAGSRDEWYVDAHGADIEHGDREWLAWGVLYHDRDEYVVTPHGVRHRGHERIALLFGNDGVRYAPTVAARPAEAPPGN
ncbi:MAG: hypothetical protein JNL08_12040 [Planctomycetes bacterium]|nr:hypothetical protein [Planctomycetota bacterium]